MAADENIRSVWSDEKTVTFLKLIHETNINAFSNGLTAPDWRISARDCLSWYVQLLIYTYQQWMETGINLHFRRFSGNLVKIGITFGQKLGSIHKFNPIPSSLFLHYQYLFSCPLLSGLSLHLLYFERVHPPPAHKQVMVPYTQLEDLHKRNKTKNGWMICQNDLYSPKLEFIRNFQYFYSPPLWEAKKISRLFPDCQSAKTTSTISAELTSLLTRSREELNLKTLVFLSRGLMVN